MVKTVDMAQIRFRTIRENLEEAVATNMEVNQHQRAIVVVEPERLRQPEFAVELERRVEIVCPKRWVS